MRSQYVGPVPSEIRVELRGGGFWLLTLSGVCGLRMKCEHLKFGIFYPLSILGMFCDTKFWCLKIGWIKSFLLSVAGFTVFHLVPSLGDLSAHFPAVCTHVGTGLRGCWPHRTPDAHVLLTMPPSSSVEILAISLGYLSVLLKVVTVFPYLLSAALDICGGQKIACTELVLFFHHVGPRTQTPLIRTSSKPLSCRASFKTRFAFALSSCLFVFRLYRGYFSS